MTTNQEIRRLKIQVGMAKAEKARLEEIKRLKLEKLKNAVMKHPAKFAAEHPVVAFLASKGYDVGKGTVNTAFNEAPKAAGKAVKTGTTIAKALGHGLQQFAKYAAYKKAQQYKREAEEAAEAARARGDYAEAERLEAKAARIRV